MRKILFKAKRKDNNVWVEGFYSCLFEESKNAEIPTIEFQHFEGASMDYPYATCNTIFAEVIPETVCQYTGSKDKNGVKIFEGDIIKSNICDLSYEIKWHDGGFYYGVPNEKTFNTKNISYISVDLFEVTGNIHDKINNQCTE